MEQLILQYIEEQPEVLARVYATAAEYSGILQGMLPVPQVYLVGSGSSYNACLAAGFAWFAAAAQVEVCEPYEFLLRSEKGLIKPGSLFVAVSQSGQSKAVLQAAAKAREVGCQTVGLAASPKCALAEVVQRLIPIACGEEQVGPKTKGYTATAATLTFLPLLFQGEGRLGEVLEDSRAEMTRYLKERETIQALAADLKDVRFCYIIGSGPNLGTAREGALKVMEIPKIPALHFDVEEAMHGPLMSMTRDSFVVVISSGEVFTPREAALLDILQHIGARGFHIGGGKILPLSQAHVPGDFQAGNPITDIVPLQLLSCFLAMERLGGEGELIYDRLYARTFTKL